MKVTFRLKNDINDVLGEFGLPQFAILPDIYNVEDMVKRIVNGYHKEVRIQSVWGGIRNPAGVLQNKIRHELTNYDEVRDSLSIALKYGMDSDLVADIREELTEMSYELISIIIDMLPPSIQVNDDQRGITNISNKQLRKANDNYVNRELKQIQQEKSYS